MAKRKRRSKRRSHGLHGLGCGCGRGMNGLGMERPDGYLTVQGPGSGGSLLASGGTKGLVVKGAIVLAAAGAGWFVYKKFFSNP